MPNNNEWQDMNKQRAYPLATASAVGNDLLIDAKLYVRKDQTAPLLTSLFSGANEATITAGSELLVVQSFSDSGYGKVVDDDGRDRGFLLLNTQSLPVPYTGSVAFVAEALVRLSTVVSGIAVNGNVLSGDVKFVPGPGVQLVSTATGFRIDVIGRPTIPAPMDAVRYLAPVSSSGLMSFVSADMTLSTPQTEASDVVCTSKSALPDADGNIPSDNDPDVCNTAEDNLCSDNYHTVEPTYTPRLISPDSSGNIQIHQEGRIRVDPIPDMGPGAIREGNETRPLQGIKFGMRG